ncbi:endonuclease domain-containing protein [Sphingomonas jeddahensis]|uniref:endonuclease domain-containing protein n=1 Tax=Sphingomonas jeddahensis TaxID=1915074 RepID=UPI001E3C02CE|nr:endonuclease domain-containing protein [Sphingomonas jeddahensis]
MTLPEVILWQALRRQSQELKFRKQHPAGDYILDFYCASARLAVEVDGGAHASPDRIARDRRRDAWLARWNVRVLRIPAQAILSDLPSVVEAILAAASPNQPLHQPTAGPLPVPGRNDVRCPTPRPSR